MIIAASGVAASCRSKDEDPLGKSAAALFERSRFTTRKYTDSLGLAKDSAMVLRLSKNLEDEITRINYSFPSDTYLSMSEGANDTLTNLTEEFVRRRDSLLRRFGDPQLMLADSLRADSLRVDSIRTVNQ